jgi:hypothetical protein
MKIKKPFVKILLFSKHMLNFEHPLFKQKFKSETFNDLI